MYHHKFYIEMNQNLDLDEPKIIIKNYDSSQIEELPSLISYNELSNYLTPIVQDNKCRFYINDRITFNMAGVETITLEELYKKIIM